MKVLVAIDSLKGSLSSIDAGNAIKRGILMAIPDAEVTVSPIADGGEGTVDAMLHLSEVQKVEENVLGPTGALIQSYYGYDERNKTAVIEIALTSGLSLVEKKRDPFSATTYGLGEMIRNSIKRGAKRIIVGLGGSATNDGGIGMLQALGFTFLGEDGNEIIPTASNLQFINKIIEPKNLDELRQIEFKVACDVTNPLVGPEGATYVYGPQKGVGYEELDSLDKAMAHYAKIASKTVGIDYKNTPGVGAAGGVGFAFKSFLKGELVSGIDLILEFIDFKGKLKDIDVVVTGEGRLDAQSINGKAPIGVARMVEDKRTKVIALAGSVTKEARICNEYGITSFFPILREITTLEEAMKPENARNNLTYTAEQIFRLLSN